MCSTNPVSGGGVISPQPAASAAPATPAASGFSQDQLTQLVTVLQATTQAIGSLIAALTGAGTLTPSAASAAAVAPITMASIPTPTPATPGAQPQPTAPPLPTVGGGGASPSISDARRGVLLIGDSLSVGTKPYLNEAMAGQPVQINATGGIRLAEGMRRYNATADKPRVVEMALFTNNGPGEIGELRSALEKTVSDARERGGKVVWATIVRPGNYGPANDLIREFAAKNPDVMALVDWQQMVASNPSYLAGDKIHGTPAGYKARAQAFADAAK